MEELFLNKNLDDLFEECHEMDKKALYLYKRTIGNPSTVGEFVDKFNECINKKGSGIMTYFKIIEKMQRKEFFTFLLDTIKNSNNNIQIQFIFKSITNLPDEVLTIKNYIPVISNIMQNNIDTEVIYHGSCLLYRIENKHPHLSEEIENTKVVLDPDSFNNLLKKFEILDKWETANHRGKTKPGYLLTQEDFVNYSMKFLKVK